METKNTRYLFQLDHDEDDHGKGVEDNNNKENKDKNSTCFNLIMMKTIMAKM